MKRYIILALAAFFAACTPQTQPGDDNRPENNENPEENTEVKPDFTPETWYSTNFWDRTDREKIGLRGPVKKWYLNSSIHGEYEYDQAGHLTLLRSVNSESTRGEWLEKRFYDNQGRLIRREYGRTEAIGGTEYDPWGGVMEITEFEYNNSGKYVWVDPMALDSRTFINFLEPEGRTQGLEMIKDLAATHYSSWLAGFTTKSHVDQTYTFNGDNLLVSYHSYERACDSVTGEDENGEITEEYNVNYAPIKYIGKYPYSGEIDDYSIVTSMTWRDNGMPLAVDGPSGLTEYSADEKRYINPVKWTCKEGKPIDALFGFCFWREWTYNEGGDMVQLLERENENSDKPWTRPFKFDYEYDTHGNWISYTTEYMVLIDGPDAPVQTGSLKRTIEYY